MPNVMVALPNIGGALCSPPQSLADAGYLLPCSNAAKTRKPLKVAGVPQTPETISAASRPKLTILWGHVEEILLLNKFFSNCRYMPQLRRYGQPDKFVRWCRDDDFLRPVFAASRVQRISDLHSKFALRPHHVPKYGKHPISDH